MYIYYESVIGIWKDLVTFKGITTPFSLHLSVVKYQIKGFKSFPWNYETGKTNYFPRLNFSLICSSFVSWFCPYRIALCPTDWFVNIAATFFWNTQRKYCHGFSEEYLQNIIFKRGVIWNKIIFIRAPKKQENCFVVLFKLNIYF